MQKKYIVRLSKQERNTLQEVVKKLKGSGQKVRRAHPPTAKLLDGEQEAKIIATRLGPSKWRGCSIVDTRGAKR